jgi:hypothetical protein
MVRRDSHQGADLRAQEERSPLVRAHREHRKNIALMTMTRAPRQLLTGWVAYSRPKNGYPEITWGRSLRKALKLPVNLRNGVL